MEYRGYIFETNYDKELGFYYTEAYRCESGSIFGSGGNYEKSVDDTKKKIDEYFDLYGE